MNDFNQTMQDLPISSLIPVGMLVVMGLLLWAAGQKILRAGFAVVGFVVGGMIGWLVGEAVGFVTPWVSAIIGAVALAVVAALAYRLAVMIAMALIFALVAPLSVVTVAEIQASRAGKSLSDGEVHNPLTDWLNKPEAAATQEKAGEAIKAAADKAQETLDRAKIALSGKLSDTTNQSIEQIDNSFRQLIDGLKQAWNKTPESLRPTLWFSAILGVVIGLILGFLAPTFSAAAVTALGGSLLWLTGLRITLTRLDVPDGWWLPSSGMSCLIVWLITTFVGLGIQWMSKRRRADKNANG